MRKIETIKKRKKKEHAKVNWGNLTQVQIGAVW
jgi:hypothetical protein